MEEIITDEQRMYRIGKEYAVRKGSHDKSAKFRRTVDAMANEYSISPFTVQLAEKFAKGLDEAEAISPGIKDAVLTGAVNVSKTAVVSIINLPENEKAEKIEAIRRGEYAKPVQTAQHRESKGADAETRELYKNVRAVANDLYNTDRVVEYTVDDLRDEIQRISDNLVGQIRRALTIRNTVLNAPSGRDTISDVLIRTEATVRKVRESIK